MDCLFIHGNFPGQFRHLAPLLAKAGHRVVFLTNRTDIAKTEDVGFEIRNYSLHRLPNESTHHYLTSLEEAVLQGQAVLREINKLMEEGFTPRFVISHGGMGLGLFIKDLLPQTVHIGYFEWYFQPSTTKFLLKEFNLDEQLRSGLRNLPILQELEKCDVAIVPTEWQKEQFPKPYHQKLQVIFDGIDTNFFKKQSKEDREIKRKHNLKLRNRETDEKFTIPEKGIIVSYATRGMETLRGFPEFMRALPGLFEEEESLYAVIAGADRRAYSYNAPITSGSWKEYLLEELSGQIPPNRIIFTGLLDYNDYRSLLWRSDLHCYFTRPYVTSWSLFEASACGARLAVNINKATSNIAKEESITWVDLDDQKKLNQQLKAALKAKPVYSELLPEYSLENSMKKWERVINDSLK